MRVTDTASFIVKSNIVHSNRYDYSQSVYIKAREKLEIICSTHGSFWQIASDHHNGFGCSQCSGLKRKTTVEFVALAKIKHGYNYLYPNTIYKGSKLKLKITCRIHGDFEQSAGDHLAGKGCQLCANIVIKNKAMLSQDEFISRSKAAHGDTYDYGEVVFNGMHEKVKIKCKVHGYFYQKANCHQRGMGCADCAKLVNRYNRNSFIDYCLKKSGKGCLYLVECFNKDERFFKIGITSNSVNTRLGISSFPYDFNVIGTKFDNPKYIWNKEKELHKILALFRYKPYISFRGETECFSELTQEIKDFFGVAA